MPAAPCDPGIRTAFTRTTSRLQSLGYSVETGELPIDLTPLGELWPRIVEIGLAHLAQADPPVMVSAARKYRDIAARGAKHGAVGLFDAMTRVFAMREAVRGLWGFDAVLMPTAAAQPWLAEEAYPTVVDGQQVSPRGHAVYTGWVNATGLPALAFPAGLAKGMPTGMQLVADHGGEATLRSLANALERIPQCDLAVVRS